MIEMFIILILMIVSQTYTYVQTDQVTHFLNGQFIVLQIYLNKSCMKKVLILFLKLKKNNKANRLFTGESLRLVGKLFWKAPCQHKEWQEGQEAGS